MPDQLESSQALTICVDIGGTFTDLVLTNASGAVFATEKVLTTPRDLAAGAIDGIRRLLEHAQVAASAIALVTHATTQTSNTLIEQTGARTALITTKGFRDILELGRESRYDVYNLFIELPRPLVPRHLRFEVDERVAADGRELRALDTAQVRNLARELREQDVESVAICLLHAYRNPAPEQAVRATLRGGGFNGAITLSSDVCPEIREYERTATTVANAYLYPRMSSYLRVFEKRLREVGIDARLSLFSSYGGRLTPAAAERRPVEMLECGAAAGVLVAAASARQVGWKMALSFDMGGTTAKAAVIKDGQPELTRSYEVARLARFTPGSGLPITASAVDLIEIGSGGGSIAAINEMGLITVGPESAGSEPGPACYGLGGTRPTVTDADLVLGYLNPDGLSDGALELDLQAAREAIAREIAAPLGRSVEDAATAVHEIVVEQMSRAARLHAVALGHDPRALRLIAFGGAGPVHACAVAARLGVSEVLVIPQAGVGAAVGLALAPMVCVVARSRLCPLEEVEWAAIERLIGAMCTEALTDLGLDACATSLTIGVSCDMRYRGQGYEVNVPFRPPPYGPDSGEHLSLAFSQVYKSRYGRENPDVAAEIVCWRVEARHGELLTPQPMQSSPRAASSATATDSRPVLFDRVFFDTPVLNREALDQTRRAGPALVVELQTTTVIPPSSQFRLDEHGNLRILMENGT